MQNGVSRLKDSRVQRQKQNAGGEKNAKRIIRKNAKRKMQKQQLAKTMIERTRVRRRIRRNDGVI